MSAIGGFIARLGFFFWFPIYLALLVVVAGQTFGMIGYGLRVVTTDFGEPTIGWYNHPLYMIVMLLWVAYRVPLSFVWRRILLHDPRARTPVVKVERVVARITGAT